MEGKTKLYIADWNAKFINYCELEKKCLSNINCISDIKQNLSRLLGEQKKDDILFYKSIIDNSHFYLNSSIKIRKNKFLKDLNVIWTQIDSFKHMDEVNLSNFTALLKDYEKMADDINYAKENNTVLVWVKDDKVESLLSIENDMNEIMAYHVKIIDYFNTYVEHEKNFYCGTPTKISRGDIVSIKDINPKYIKK
jgi:hypothetical protein